MRQTATNLDNSPVYYFLRYILYAVLLMPLLVWSIFLFPFITTKILYFRILIEIALVIYLPLALKYPEMRPQWNWITKSVWIYMAVIFVTSILGVNFYHSFWGTIERGEGIVTMLHFAAYFTMLPAVFRRPKDWKFYLSLVVILTTFTAFYGMSQLGCTEHVKGTGGFCDLLISTSLSGGARISATIGNAAFFAAFLIFGVFLSLYLWKQAETAGKKFLFGSAFFFQLIILFQTQTRGAILAAAVAFLFYFVLNLFKSENRTTKIISAVLLLSLLSFFVAIYTNKDASWVRANNTINRLATISPSDITTQSRLDNWKASYNGWTERLWTGYGYENYNIAFNQHYSPRIFKDQGSQIWFDRAHNLFFDIALTSGIVGLVSYFMIWFFAVFTLFRLFRKKDSDLTWRLPAILFILLTAYALQNLFVFDTQATYLLFFVLLAHLSFLHSEYLTVQEEAATRKTFNPGFTLTAGLLVLFLVVTYFVNWRPALANYNTTEALKSTKLGQYRDTVGYFEKALGYGTYMNEEIRQRLADLTGEITASGQLSPVEQRQAFEYIISELKKSISEAPLDVKNHLYLMNILNRIGVNDKGVLDENVALGQRAIELSPSRQQIYFELGQAEFSRDNIDHGLEYFQTAIDLNPETKVSQFNMLLASIIAGRDDLVARQKKIILEDIVSPFTVEELVSLARANSQAGNLEEVISSYQQAVSLRPTNLDLRVRLASSYAEACDIENASAEVAEAIKLNPAYAEQGAKFLAELETTCEN